MLQARSDVYVIELLFRLEVLPYEILPVDGVVSHVEFEELGYGFLVVDVHGVEPDVVSDELPEFRVRYLSETLEPRNLHPVLSAFTASSLSSVL